MRLRAENKYIPKPWLDLITPREEIDAERIIDDVILNGGLVTR